MPKLTHIREPGKLTEWPVSATAVFDVGDLLYWDGTSVQPVSLFTYATSESVTRRSAIPYFVGVSLEKHTGRETAAGTTVVSSGGIYEYTLTSATAVIGSLVGFELNTTPTPDALYDQTLQIVIEIADAIGYVIKEHGATTTTVECRLLSSFDPPGGMLSLQKFLTFYGDLNAAANIVTNWLFKTRVKLMSIASIETVAATGNSTLSLLNGSTTLSDTHIVTATAVGTFLRTTIADTGVLDIFAHNGALTIKCDGTASGGNATLILEYMLLPVVA